MEATRGGATRQQEPGPLRTLRGRAATPALSAMAVTEEKTEILSCFPTTMLGFLSLKPDLSVTDREADSGYTWEESQQNLLRTQTWGCGRRRNQDHPWVSGLRNHVDGW